MKERVLQTVIGIGLAIMTLFTLTMLLFGNDIVKMLDYKQVLQATEILDWVFFGIMATLITGTGVVIYKNRK